MTTAHGWTHADARLGLTTRRAGVALAVLVMGLVGTGSAAAGELAIAAEGGYFDLSSAKKSAQAVFDGSSGGGTFGGSVRYALDNGFFIAAGARTFNKEGQRVAVVDAAGPVFPLGHPLKLRLVPVYGQIGYRFRHGQTVVPYLAVGGGSVSFREESTVGGITTTETQSKSSIHGAGGVEYGRGGLRVGVEVMLSSVPDTIGVGGVSKVYGETNVGGLSVVGRIAYAF
jgi:Outer membrane protein beta-barrel domain